MDIPERIAALRKLMEEKQLQAYIIPSTDPHMSEYVPSHWTAREWISGFTGSAGTVVVTQNTAGLWTDSRYFIQAETQLENSGIELYKLGLPETPAIQDWLLNNLSKDTSVGFDGACVSLILSRNLKSSLGDKNIHIVGDYDLVDQIWTNRPEIPDAPVFTHDLQYCGKSRTEKLSEIRSEMEKLEADYHFIGSLDDIAWTFNLRGQDVDYNPVVVAYAMINKNSTRLYLNEVKVPLQVVQELSEDGIEIVEYEKIFSDLEELPASATVLIDQSRTNRKIYDHISANIIERENPSQLLKSQKNSTEIEGMKQAMVKDGVALTHFYYWLEQNLGTEKITELTMMEKLKYFRSQQEDFKGESFNSIVGYGEHGAIVHYSSTIETDVEIQAESFVLIDSGAQYLNGTTDITRTIPLGPLSEEQKTDFTLVLKGMIQLSMAKFPRGTRGCNLDILARQPLWENGRNYGHGTGHGVGCFLNVHEGPQSIRQEIKEQAILPGMISSNEPGLYREGKYGIRHENLILCKEDKESEFGEFLDFETLTLCHFETRAIQTDLLTEKERTWLNNYHQTVFEKLSPLLDETHRKWLQRKTAAI
ncbi:MAG: aminopeptidase P family protein [Marinifilaceae bacterium]